MADTSFPDFITNRRRELDLTLGDVASRLGVSPISVSNWSNGQATPEPDKLVALAELLDVPADDLASMAGVSVKSPEPAVNLIPEPAVPPTEEPELASGESTGPIAMLRATEDQGAGTPGDRPGPAQGTPDRTEAAPAPQMPDPMDSELAELIEEAAAGEGPKQPAPVERARALRRRPTMTRRRPPPEPAEQPVTALPLTYIEDPKQLTRYRIRWALTVVILVIMFFILLWASRELLSALSEVKQAVTPGGIGN